MKLKITRASEVLDDGKEVEIEASQFGDYLLTLVDKEKDDIVVRYGHDKSITKITIYDDYLE